MKSIEEFVLESINRDLENRINRLEEEKKNRVTVNLLGVDVQINRTTFKQLLSKALEFKDDMEK